MYTPTSHTTPPASPPPVAPGGAQGTPSSSQAPSSDGFSRYAHRVAAIFTPPPPTIDPDILRHMGASDAAWHDFGPHSRRRISLVLCALLVVFLLWAALAEIDEVTRGTGQVVPSQRLQVVQHLEGGILMDVAVKEGDRVEADQVLGQVDNVGASALMRDALQRIRSHEAALARLEGELEGKEPFFTQELQEDAPAAVNAERSTFAIRQQQRAEELKVLDSQIEQRQQELRESLSRKGTFEESLALMEQREQRIKPLVQRKLHSEVDYLTLQQEKVRIKGDLDALTTSIPKLESALREAQQRKDLSEATRRSELNKEVNSRSAEMASLRESHIASADKVTRTELRSPVRGIVNRLLITTKGGIVKPGGEIMEIIPLDDSLLVEAKIRPADIAFIHPGQHAVVKITAYDSSIYGTLPGTVEQISADTITGPAPQNESYYLVKVRTQENVIHYRNQRLPITPGMVAGVDILTGKKSILDYLLKPILKARENALRER